MVLYQMKGRVPDMIVFIVVKVVWFLGEHEMTNEPVFATMDKKEAQDFAADLNMQQRDGDISVST